MLSNLSESQLASFMACSELFPLNPCSSKPFSYIVYSLPCTPEQFFVSIRCLHGSSIIIKKSMKRRDSCRDQSFRMAGMLLSTACAAATVVAPGEPELATGVPYAMTVLPDISADAAPVI